MNRRRPERGKFHRIGRLVQIGFWLTFLVSAVWSLMTTPMSQVVRVVMPFVVTGAIIVFGLVLLIVVRVVLDNKYKTLFADEHIVELADRLAKAKAACLALLDRPYEGEMKFRDDAAREQGNLFETSAHLVIYYTIDHEGTDYRHHLSMSYSRGALARAGLENLAGIIGHLLQVDLLRADIWQSERMVGHLRFVLGEAEQRLFAVRAVDVPSIAQMKILRFQARQIVREIRARERRFVSAAPD